MVKLHLTAVMYLYTSNSLFHHTNAYPIPSEENKLQPRILGAVVASNLVAGAFIPLFTKLGKKLGSSDKGRDKSESAESGSTSPSAKSKDSKSANSKSVDSNSDESADSDKTLFKRSSYMSTGLLLDANSNSDDMDSSDSSKSQSKLGPRREDLLHLKTDQIMTVERKSLRIPKPGLGGVAGLFRSKFGRHSKPNEPNEPNDLSAAQKPGRLGIFSSVLAGTAALSLASGFVESKFSSKEKEGTDETKSKSDKSTSDSKESATEEKETETTKNEDAAKKSDAKSGSSSAEESKTKSADL